MDRPTAPQTAKIVKARLRAAFPGVDFSLIGSRGTGYGYYSLHWTMGPSVEQVEAITRDYDTQGFDPMTDSTTYLKSKEPSGIRWISLHPRRPDREGYICPSP